MRKRGKKPPKETKNHTLLHTLTAKLFVLWRAKIAKMTESCRVLQALQPLNKGFFSMETGRQSQRRRYLLLLCYMFRIFRPYFVFNVRLFINISYVSYYVSHCWFSKTFKILNLIKHFDRRVKMKCKIPMPFGRVLTFMVGT